MCIEMRSTRPPGESTLTTADRCQFPPIYTTPTLQAQFRIELFEALCFLLYPTTLNLTPLTCTQLTHVGAGVFGASTALHLARISQTLRIYLFSLPSNSPKPASIGISQIVRAEHYSIHLTYTAA